MARKRFRTLVFRVGCRPQWYRDEVHGNEVYKFLVAMAPGITGHDFPDVKLEFVDTEDSASWVYGYDGSGNELCREKIDMSAPYLTALMAKSSPFQGIHIEGELSLDCLQLIDDLVSIRIADIGRQRGAATPRGKRDRALAHDETLLRELVAFLAGVPATRAELAK